MITPSEQLGSSTSDDESLDIHFAKEGQRTPSTITSLPSVGPTARPRVADSSPCGAGHTAAETGRVLTG